MTKMLGKTTRLCDTKCCTCNSDRRGRAPVRAAKRRERQAFRRELSNM